MVHIIFEEEEETVEQIGEQNFKAHRKSDEKRKIKQTKHPSMANEFLLPGKYGEAKMKKNRYKYLSKKKSPVVGERLFPYEENELMTRYDGFWIMKEGVKKLAQLKATLEAEKLGDKEMKKKLLAAKRLAHSKLKRELMKRQKQKNSELKNLENAASDKVKTVKSLEFKNHKKLRKSPADSNVNNNLSKSETSSERGKVKGKTETNPKFGSEKGKVKGKTEAKPKTVSDKGKVNEKTKTKGKTETKPETGADKSKVKGKAKTKLSIMMSDSSKNKDYLKLQNKDKTSQKFVESPNSETVSMKGSNIDFLPSNKENKKKSKYEVQQTTKGSKRKSVFIDDCDLAENQNLSHKLLGRKKLKTDFAQKDAVTCSAQKSTVPFKFEENYLMTRFEGSWVKRAVVPQLNHLREEHMKHIYSTREDGNSDRELTEEEQKLYLRLMKKKIRMEYRNLRRELTNQGRKECMNEDKNFMTTCH